MNCIRFSTLAVAALLAACQTAPDAAAPQPASLILPSWNDGATKSAILDFVARATDENGTSYIPGQDRIAVFDNDGTLWSERPVYFQLLFAIDRVRALASEHPGWNQRQPFKAAIEGDMETLAAGGERALMELVMASHAGTTTEEFERIVSDWISTAEHPTLHKRYTELVYLPMIELLEYLRANGFKTFIVSGGGIEFMRPWVPGVYGIPPEQIVGSSIKTQFEVRDSGPVLVRLPEIDFVNDGPGKPVGIHKFIGRRPVAAFGNSDGDLQMLQWTTAGSGLRFAAIVHHTDADREFAYDRDSHVGRLDRALGEAGRSGWTVIDMKNDWKMIHPE